LPLDAIEAFGLVRTNVSGLELRGSYDTQTQEPARSALVLKGVPGTAMRSIRATLEAMAEGAR
jgi:hypothetical protein